MKPTKQPRVSPSLLRMLAPIDSIKPDPKNARKHPERNLEAIRESYRKFGQQRPIIVDRNNVIRAGNGQWEAAKSLGWKSIAVLYTDLEGDALAAFALADNRTSELSAWDDAKLAEALAELPEAFHAAAGFDGDALRAALRPEEPKPEAKPADEPPPAPPPTTQPGDLWKLGRHRLLCGDATDADTIAWLMDGQRASVCFTSPPYGLGAAAALHGTHTPGKKRRKSLYIEHADDPDQWPKLMRGWYQAAAPVVDVTICNVQLLGNNKTHLIAWLNEFRHDLIDIAIWDKVHGPPHMQRNVLSSTFEFLVILGAKAKTIPCADFHGTIPNVFRCNPAGTNEHADTHRATMPVALPMWALGTLCSQATSALDPFTGSGTTLVAAEKLGIRFFGTELTPSYVDISVARWEALTGQTATRHSKDGRTAKPGLPRSRA